MVWQNLCSRIDCSQNDHCLQIADQQSIDLIAYNFARTFANQRSAQEHSHSLSAFASFMRESLDSAIIVDQFAQYVDDVGIATNTHYELVEKVLSNFKKLVSNYQCL